MTRICWHRGNTFNPLTSVYLFPRGENFNAIKEFEHMMQCAISICRTGTMEMTWRCKTLIGLRTVCWRQQSVTDTSLTLVWSIILRIGLLLKEDFVGMKLLIDWKTNDTLQRLISSLIRLTDIIVIAMINDRSFYADVMADVTKRWGALSLVANVGTAFSHTSYDVSGFQGGLKAPSNIFTPNGIDYNRVSGDNRPIFDITRHAIHSVLGSVELGWQERIYLTVTGL